MQQGYCYSTPLAQLSDHPLAHFVHFETEWCFCSWLTEVKEANYWQSFPQSTCRLILAKGKDIFFGYKTLSGIVGIKFVLNFHVIWPGEPLFFFF